MEKYIINQDTLNSILNFVNFQVKYGERISGIMALEINNLLREPKNLARLKDDIPNC